MGSGRGRKEVYAYDEAQKESAIAELLGTPTTAASASGDSVNFEQAISSGKISIQRFKGLGEMMPEQLWSTTMDPKRRSMKKVTVSDASMADVTLSILMGGDSVAERRELISQNAEQFAMDDLDV